MSKINALRLINLNYNNNAIRISDEIFQMKGETTLLSLRNGGGKSVLVQMMIAPFVHPRYRNTKDRAFENYFTTNKPSFIMVEWALDQGAGYVLTGMMVRRNQNMDADTSEPLEIIQFICEYTQRNPQDIYHLPVVEKNKKEMILKNYNACRQLFEEYKRDRSMKFFYYDMNNSAQSRQYFDKLMEYQINYKEWETVMKKINIKESGLSDLFSDCRDEKGLIEKWFLDTIESKLNKDKNRMKEFQNILEKYIGQYKDNQSKIERRDTIKAFQEDAVEVQERAEQYQQCEIKERDQESNIAVLRLVLQEEETRLKDEKTGLDQDIAEVDSKMEHVEFERISKEIYAKRKEEMFHISNRDMIGMERDALEQESEQIEQVLHTFYCAKQRDTVSMWQKEHQMLAEKLSVLQQGEKDLEPERKQIGSKLYAYYDQKVTTTKAKQEENLAVQQETANKEQKALAEAAELQSKIMDLSIQEAKNQTKIQAFDEKEDSFNQRYQERFARNILGEYEAGSLTITGKQYQDQQETLERSYLQNRKKVEDTQEQIRTLQRAIEDLKEEKIKTDLQEQTNHSKQQKYEEEMKKRQVILRYLDLSKEELWNRAQILSVAERKLSDCEHVKRELEKEEDKLQKEYRRLTQGKVLELPEELESMLENLGIHYVYGMEWLNKNKNSAKENEVLVKRHPFLPYALLMSEQELQKLEQQKEEIYTSFPVPIIRREQLEQAMEKNASPVQHLADVSFYVWFNQNLLDETALQRLIQEKEAQIRKKKEQIAVRAGEYREYFERLEMIRNQEITQEGYEALQEEKKEIEEHLEKCTEQMEKESLALQDSQNLLKELQQTCEAERQKGQHYKERAKDFALLCDQYEQYLEQKSELERLQREEQRTVERQKRNQEQLSKIKESLITLTTELDNILTIIRQNSEKCRMYESYAQEENQGENQKSDQESIQDENSAQENSVLDVEKQDNGKKKIYAEEIGILDIDSMEARYEAITSKMTYERQDLERQLKNNGDYLHAAKEDLQDLMTKYDISEKQIEDVIYQKKEEQHQEILLEDKKKKLKIKDRQWNEEDKTAAVKKNQVTEIYKRMKKRFQVEEPLPEEEIVTTDFDETVNQYRYEKEQLTKQVERIREKQISIGENLTSLADYADFSCEEDQKLDVDVLSFSAKELRDYKGSMLRDYRICKEDTHKRKERLEQLLNNIVRKEIYQEDFYKKPIENLLALTEHAEQVLAQLHTILMSYQTLMEKLAVDISVIEKERDKIMELLLDYVQEVHHNLGMIDHNSTITIREKPVKMLKLIVPEWEENESIYQLRLQDFMTELTEKSITLLNDNQNPQELIGTRVTTRNLYDSIIGTGNVQIKLYKIEEQREYPITWTEVAKNSGGEGFLSAFVILSSLLYYMRKDDSDIFAERNEGKVLIMDNPFAQTNAAHLLKPLMDMAKKTNTQLICLSGLGGDSIYGRFDNIYVLNLVNASMRTGQQYLKAEHARGTEEETMVVSQIEVVGQQSLLF